MGNIKYSDYKSSGLIHFAELPEQTHIAEINNTYESVKIQFIGEYDLYINNNDDAIQLSSFGFNNDFELTDIAINNLKIVYKGNVQEHSLQYILFR